MNGYLRHTADGTLISVTRGGGIRIYVKGNGPAPATWDRSRTTTGRIRKVEGDT